MTIGGVATSYYRFQTEDGVINYYDANGASADNFLLRKPMSGGEFRSGYGNRLHPVLGVYRLHSGVDWSAPAGTPIVAAGDGEVVRLEYSSGGYGRYTVVRHANGYETAYAHQSAFAQGLAIGDRVRQGQVIGYVGSTGLSTGNHLHYEVRINGQTVNPLTIRLPEGRVLTGDELVAFQQARRSGQRSPRHHPRRNTSGRGKLEPPTLRQPRRWPSNRARKADGPLPPTTRTMAPSVNLAGENLVGQRILHLALDHPLQRPCAVDRIVALLAPTTPSAVSSSSSAILRSPSSFCRCRSWISTILPISFAASSGGTG